MLYFALDFIVLITLPVRVTLHQQCLFSNFMLSRIDLFSYYQYKFKLLFRETMRDHVAGQP